VIVDLKNGSKCEGILANIDKINMKINITNAKRFDESSENPNEEFFETLEINKEDIKEVKLVHYEQKEEKKNVNAIPENKAMDMESDKKDNKYNKDSSFFDNLSYMSNVEAKNESIRYNDKNKETFNLQDNEDGGHSRGNYRGRRGNNNRGGYRGNNRGGRGGYRNQGFHDNNSNYSGYRGNNRGGRGGNRGGHGYNDNYRGNGRGGRGGYRGGNRGGYQGGYQGNYQGGFQGPQGGFQGQPGGFQGQPGGFEGEYQGSSLNNNHNPNYNMGLNNSNPNFQNNHMGETRNRNDNRERSIYDKF